MLFLVRRDRLAALNLEAYRRWPMLRGIPIVGRGHASERFNQRLIMFDAVVLLAAAALYLISWSCRAGGCPTGLVLGGT